MITVIHQINNQCKIVRKFSNKGGKMYIKEIVIDGFKSYNTRTVINSDFFWITCDIGFDPHFNAITGLNGSGKSNVFDAICFVMGITSLSHVRVSNLQELIYKYGNSGIEKATVSLTFDNHAKDKSCPAGLQDFDEFTITRQVVKGGKSKYYLNGTNATNEKIKGLFQSVQLNVNNPHFLIMQGKVTQVVKMKPRELLSLLEETAGTSLYEGKKKTAQSTIEKKDKKLEEIEMLCGPIQEKIEKHKQEKEMLAKYKANDDKLSRIRRILVAHEYYKLTQAIARAESEKEQLATRKATILADLSKLQKTIKEIISEQEMHSKGSENEETRKSITCQKQAFTAFQKELNTLSGEIAAKYKEIAQEQEDEKAKQEEIDELRQLQDRKSKEKDEFKMTMSKNDSVVQDKEKYVTSLEEQLESVEGGSQEDEQKALRPILNRIEQVKDQIQECYNEIDTRKGKCQNLSRQRQELEQIIKKTRKSIVSTETLKAKILSDLERINKELEKIEQSPGEDAYQRSVIEQAELRKKCEAIQGAYNEIQAKYRFDIEYKSTSPEFDKKKVYGRVLMLFKPKDLKYAKALEYIAGTKVWNIVVDNEHTSKWLIENQCFIQRETCIPNSKIIFRNYSAESIAGVEAKGEGRVHYALNVIEHDERVTNSMKFVFGGIVPSFFTNQKLQFICDTVADAKRVAFREGFRAVTLDGDIYDPKGSVMGGYNENYHRIETAFEFSELKRHLLAIKKELEAVSQRVEKGNNLEKNKKELLGKKEELEHRKQLLEEEEKAKDEGTLESQTKRINEEIQQEKNTIEKVAQAIKEHSNELKKLEGTVQAAQGGKGDLKEMLKNNIRKVGDEIEKLKRETEKLKKEVQKREIQIQKCEADCLKTIKTLSDTKEHTHKLKTELETLKGRKQGLEIKLETTKKSLNELESKLIASDIKEKELAENRERVGKIMENKASELDSLAALVKSQASEYEERTKLIKVLRSENPFIESEEDRFGVEGSEYDFDSLNIKELSDQSGKLQKEMEKLKKMINIHVDEVGDAIEKQYDSLVEKKRIVEKDKERLLKIISELDSKKKEALKEVWERVNTDFGNIFSTLLPSARARLILVDEEDITEGIEFQIAFKDIVKESLAELSGGQRTLIALSYIFALLKYKPAPLYILDEIDAALDLSHTQNIGVMIREQFPQSQFLVISLKEGMFNNANVLYKVSFVNGGSKVDRMGLREIKTEDNSKEHNKVLKRKKVKQTLFNFGILVTMNTLVHISQQQLTTSLQLQGQIKEAKNQILKPF
eukprot:TRINITY_DN245_c0_g1_i10.p1 TRINITY_DN245_c0_g1~~TRINITY_DN245_c0_g1_i10.p1  ORF type:complete len:1283 (-),score=245.41 TRINITY_DN245_c0_g1_i10:16427-20275(-)